MAVREIILYLCDVCGYSSSVSFVICPAHTGGQDKPKHPGFGPWPIPEPSKVHCSECGMDFSGIVGYCCPRGNCPVGLGPIMCSYGGGDSR